MRKIIGSIDIGSDEIKIIVGEIFDGELNVLCALSEETKGMKENRVVNEELFIQNVTRMIENISDRLGFKVKNCELRTVS